MSLLALPIIDGELSLDEGFLTPEQADSVLSILLDELPWRHDEITVFAKTHLMPRLHCYQTQTEQSLTYSNLTLPPQPYHPKVLQLKKYLEALTGLEFNAVLINLYRDGLDKMGWHADDEPEYGVEPNIASISLGAKRAFKLKHNNKAAGDITLELGHGSLLLMAGSLQQHWQHSLPQRKNITQVRINLTFRYLVSAQP